MSYPSIKIQSKEFEITLIDEDLYTPGSADNLSSYPKEYWLSESNHFSTCYGVIVGPLDEPLSSCVFAADGGRTAPYAHSAFIHDDSLILAIGDHIARLGLPSLDLFWSLEADQITCFGVHYSQKHECIVSHGELEICRISMNGEIDWRAGGKDIFTGELNILEDQVLVTDFYEEKYSIDITTGKSTILDG
jgi:hypothetical protein